jgi:hypothetical protein
VELGRRNAKVATDLAAADRLAASGKIVDAAQAYGRLGARTAGSADELAHAVVVDAARRNPASVLKTLHKLEGKRPGHAGVSAIERSVAEVGSPAAAKHVATALRGGKPLSNASGTVAVERGKLVVTRDIERLSATPATRAGPIDLSRAEVYVDTRLRVGREGLTPDTGGHVARWARRRDVTIEVMDRSAIGALPDRIVVRSTKTRCACPCRRDRTG